MAGYGIQNAVGSAIDNSVKIKKMMDLLPSEEDKAVANATNAEEAARLREELAKGDTIKAQQEAQAANKSFDNIKKQIEQFSNDPETSKLSKQKVNKQMKMFSDQIAEAATVVDNSQQKFKKYQQAVEVTSEAHRQTIQAKIAALEKAGQRKKTIFERLRGGSK